MSSVTTQFVFNPSAEATGTVNESAPGTLQLRAGMSYEDNPTIAYSPLHGEEFVTRLLSPVSLDTLLLLFHSGWSVERILRVGVQRLNDVKNAPTASGPTPTTAPEFETFLEVARALRGLQTRDALVFGYEQEGDAATLVLRIEPAALDSPEAGLVRDALGLDDGTGRYEVTPQRLKGGGDQIAVQTRSLMGILFYLSQGVEVPEADVRRGAVTVTRTADGGVFDWGALTGDLMDVRTAPARPPGAAIAVQYRGHWFYVGDADLESKSTFALLTQLFSLQAGKIERAQPMFTLPLSR